MSASVRAESGIFVDFHFSEGGDLEFCSTFLRFRERRARSAIEVVRVCASQRRSSRWLAICFDFLLQFVCRICPCTPVGIGYVEWVGDRFVRVVGVRGESGGTGGEEPACGRFNFRYGSNCRVDSRAGRLTLGWRFSHDVPTPPPPPSWLLVQRRRRHLWRVSRRFCFRPSCKESARSVSGWCSGLSRSTRMAERRTCQTNVPVPFSCPRVLARPGFPVGCGTLSSGTIIFEQPWTQY